MLSKLCAIQKNNLLFVAWQVFRATVNSESP